MQKLVGHTMGKLLVGAGVKVYINGRDLGTIVTFEWQSATPRKEIKGMDTVTPFEQAPTQTTIEGQFTTLKVTGNGGMERLGVVGGAFDFLREKYFTIQLRERYTNTLLFRADRCSVESQRWSVQKGFVVGNISFKGIEWSNEYTQGPRN